MKSLLSFSIFQLCLILPGLSGVARGESDMIRLKSGAFQPQEQASLSKSEARERYVLIQFREKQMDATIADLRKRGVRVMEWVPDRTVSAYVPAKVSLDHPGVRWVGTLGQEDKMSPHLPKQPGDLHVVVDFFPEVPQKKIPEIIRESGGRIRKNSYLLEHSRLVLISRDDLNRLAGFDGVSYISPASKALILGEPVHVCPGVMTEYGPMATFVSRGEGWDGAGANPVALRYYFANGTPDIVGEEGEVERALTTWSNYAQISWTRIFSPNSTRCLDFAWSSTDPVADGPGGVLAWAYFPSPPNSEPIAGDVTFDEGETWRIGADVDLFSVALHEIGHALGLDHSSDPNAVMYAYYQRVSDLRSDDIAGIRALYASTDSGGGGGGDTGDAFEPDNSSGQAGTLIPGSSQSRSIFPVGDEDWASFELAGDAGIVLQTSGPSGDTRMWLYDASLNLIEFSDDSGSGLFSRIDRGPNEGNTLKAGRYFVRIDEYGNNNTIPEYNLDLSITYTTLGDSFEPNNTSNAATPLPLNSSQVHSILPANDIDYFVFSLTETSEVILQTSGASGDTRMWLFGSSLSTLEFNDDGGTNLFSRIDRTLSDGDALPAGTYYVSVDESGNNNEIAQYTISLIVNPLGGGGDAYEPNDSLNAAWSPGFHWERTWLSDISGPALQENDDWYEIEVIDAEFERLQIRCVFSNAQGDIDLELYDAGGNRLAFSETVTDNEFIDHIVSGTGTYYIRVHYGDAGNPYNLWWDALATDGSDLPPAKIVRNDYDGDGRSDLAVYDPFQNQFWVLGSTVGVISIPWGLAESDLPVGGDYDGDGQNDPAVLQENGTWHLGRTQALYAGLRLGGPGVVPVPEDYDGDGSTDMAIYEPWTGTWHQSNTRTGYFGVGWGGQADIPVPGDYDGDGLADVGVYRPGNQTWYLLCSSDGIKVSQWGLLPSDQPVPGDYDGDGKTDLAVFQANGTWHLARSKAGYAGVRLGEPGDIPVPADYDGDGAMDVAVYQSSGVWHISTTTEGYRGVRWGLPGDVPVRTVPWIP
ncbi:MAG: matrixin family metalloprotease [Kiritimatiellia bacterium]